MHLKEDLLKKLREELLTNNQNFQDKKDDFYDKK
jgi:hypothetical protein